jgi:hypothetical protein
MPSIFCNNHNNILLELTGSYAECATIIQEVLSMKEKVLSYEITMHYEVEELKVLLAKLFCAIGYFFVILIFILVLTFN